MKTGCFHRRNSNQKLWYRSFHHLLNIKKRPLERERMGVGNRPDYFFFSMIFNLGRWIAGKEIA